MWGGRGRGEIEERRRRRKWSIARRLIVAAKSYRRTAIAEDIQLAGKGLVLVLV